MKILIIDDNDDYIQYLENQLFVFFSNFCNIVDIEYISNNFLYFDYSQDYDYTFLDIDLVEADGFEIAKIIKSNHPTTNIVFISAKSELIHNSLLIQPFYFIRKSNIQNDLKKFFIIVNRLLIENKLIDFNFNYEKTRTFLKHILFIESSGHILMIHTKNEILYDNRSLKNIFKLLNEDFVQIHKSFIINLNYLKKYNNTFIILVDNTRLNIGRRYKEQFDKQYKEFLIK